MGKNNAVIVQSSFFMIQFAQFTRSYKITPLVLISASHSTTASGNLPPDHNGITTWIEVIHNALKQSYVLYLMHRWPKRETTENNYPGSEA